METPQGGDAAAAPAEQEPARSGEWGALEVALAGVLAFLPAIACGYVYDDILLIRDNRYAHGLDQLRRAFTTYFWQLAATGSGGLRYYRPLITTSYILDWLVSSGKPWFFHFENIVAHAFATYLVVKLAERFTGRRVVALGVGLLFALHPSRTESVEWIAGRTDVYMTLFMLLSVELAWRGSVRATPGLRALIPTAFFLLALLCKEAAVMLPLLLGVDVLLAPEERRPALKRNLAVAVGIAAVFAALRIFVFPVRVQKLEVTPTYGLMTVAAYVERVLIPWPQTFFHRPLVFEGGHYVYPLPLVIVGALVLAGYTIFTAIALRKDRVSGLLLVSAAVAFGPLLNFTYTGIFVTTSDHFLYLPLALFLFGVGRYAGARVEGLAARPRLRMAFAGLLTVYVAIDVLRSFDFSDQTAIYKHELAENPENPVVLKSLSEEQARKGEIDEAFGLLLASTKPEAKKYRLLMPDWLAYQSYFRLVGLQASRTADGNVQDLLPLYAELLSLESGGANPVHGKVGELTLGIRLSPEEHQQALAQGGREILAAEAAFLATRLGDDKTARRLLGTLGPDAVDYLPNVQNLCLAHARLEDFDGARRWIQVMETRLASTFPERSLDPLKKRLAKTEALFEKSRLVPTKAERKTLRAEAFAEVGAYLRALRELRPVVESGANVGPVGPVYVNLLVAAGLDSEALDVASQAIGPEQAQALVQRSRTALSPHMRKLRKPEGPSAWKTLGKNPGVAP